jgi:sugar lactone lactonase YvrE
MNRRGFLGLEAGLPQAVAACSIDLKSIKTRPNKKVNIAYQAPHSAPNGLQATREGMWVLDEARGNVHAVSLVNWADGKLIREFQITGMNGPSGLTIDNTDTMWIDSADNSMIFKIDYHKGELLAKYWAPGAGRSFRMKGDPQRPGSNTAAGAAPKRPALAAGQLPMDATTGAGGLGGQGMEHRDGLLYISTLAARRVFVLDPKTWEVQAMWDTPGNRSHGCGWEGDTLWVADTNLRAFFRYDTKAGKIVERIQTAETDPVIHGATVHDGYLWYCEVEQGRVCNIKL